MTYAIANRVFETSTSTGVGSFNLGGSITGFQTFVSGIGDGNTCNYFISNDTDWEAGIGTITAGAPDVLSRDTVLESSNADAKVNWGSGTKNVYIPFLAQNTVVANKDNSLSGNNTFTGTNTFTQPVTIGAVEYTNVDGTAGQALITDGAGNADFSDLPNEFDINELTTVSPAVGDFLPFADVSDENNPKKATVQNVFNTVEKQIGVNQTWQDVTTSRAFSTTYTNSTGRPILVSIYTERGGSPGQGSLQLTIGGQVVSFHDTGDASDGFVSGIVPNGQTYSISYVIGYVLNSTAFWKELR